MSDIGVGSSHREGDQNGGEDGDLRPGGDPRPPDRAPRKGRMGLLPVLAVLLVLLVGGFFVGRYAVAKASDLFGSAPDYPGPGTGSVQFQVKQGDTSTTIAQGLKKSGVVKSVQAFLDAARKNDRSRSIQVGFYGLKKQMKAEEALVVLIDSKNLVQGRVVIPEGYRAKEVPAAVAKTTDISAASVRRALADPARLGLPPEAGGKVEGYLFPATYTVTPGETAVELLRAMVAQTVAAEKDLDLSAKAAELGMTSQQVLTVASMLEYEGSRDEDYPKIAQAIYNRLKAGMPIQSDATVAYANNLSGTVYTTAAQRANPSPYNTYAHPGLPPGPIGSPGTKTIEAALNPKPGPWLYWVVVNLRTGETKFNTTYSGHLRDVQDLQKYCQTSSAC